MTELNRSPIYSVLTTPQLVMGGERDWVLSTAIICLMLGVVTVTLIGAISGLGIWLIALWALRKMAKADPLMTKVYWRHIKYRPWYPARSTPWREM